MKHIALILFCIFLLMPSQANAGQDPVQTIIDLQTALNNADEKLFEKSVNMQSLVGQCVDVFMEDASKEGQQTMPPVLALILSAANMNKDARDTLRDALITEVSEFVRYGVRSGAYAGKSVEAAPPGGILAPFLANASMGRKEITHIGEAIAESGAMYVTFAVKDHENGNIYPVEAWLRADDGSNWQIIGLRNVRTISRMLQGEASAI